MTKILRTSVISIISTVIVGVTQINSPCMAMQSSNSNAVRDLVQDFKNDYPHASRAQVQDHVAAATSSSNTVFTPAQIKQGTNEALGKK